MAKKGTTTEVVENATPEVTEGQTPAIPAVKPVLNQEAVAKLAEMRAKTAEDKKKKDAEREAKKKVKEEEAALKKQLKEEAQGELSKIDAAMADLKAQRRMITGATGGSTGFARPKSVSGQHKSVRALAEELLLANHDPATLKPTITYEQMAELVLAEFPESAFKKTHYSWYVNKILKKGEYKNPTSPTSSETPAQ